MVLELVDGGQVLGSVLVNEINEDAILLELFVSKRAVQVQKEILFIGFQTVRYDRTAAADIHVADHWHEALRMEHDCPFLSPGIDNIPDTVSFRMQ